MADGIPNFDDMNDELNNQPSEDNPLGDIDPMKWLESLAARQGATEGFTTDHDLDIAEIDPDSAIIEEPGYTPFTTFGSDTSQVKAQEAPVPQEPAQPPQQPEAYQYDYGSQDAYGQPAESYGSYEQQPQDAYSYQEPAPAYEEPAGGFDMSGGIPDDIDPMAWLESLAARQGATEGFTTDHNLDIAEIDPDSVVIDEPGYTPSETIRSRHQPQEAPAEVPEEPAYQEPETPQPESPPAEAYPPQQTYGDQYQQSYDYGSADQYQQPYDYSADDQYQQSYDYGSADQYQQQSYDYGSQDAYGQQEYPPAESYPQQPYADQYQQSYDYGSQDAYGQPAESYGSYEQQPQDGYGLQEPPAPYEEPAPAGGFDMSGGIPDDIDPMAWLESLAARQGATEGFTTDHNLDIAEIDPDSVVIDEPGYTPSETIRSRHQPQEAPAEAAPPPPSLPEMPAAAGSDAYAEMDWLDAESGSTEEFLQSLSADIEPIAAEQNPDISWLDDIALTTEQIGSDEPFPGRDTAYQDTEPIYDIDESFGAYAEPEPVEDAIPATHTQDEIVGSIEGLSDDDIARLQAEGRLTGEQELAWLQRQAMGMRDARLQAEAEYEEIPDDELEPAVEADIPDWLRQSAVVSDEIDDSGIFVDELSVPTEPVNLPDFIDEAAFDGGMSEIELPDFTLEDASGLPPAPVSEMPAVVDDAGMGVLNLDDYDPTVDEWAQALDEEHERMEAGLEEDPTWFRTAMEQVEEIPIPEAEEPQEVRTQAPAQSIEPGWLASVAEESPAAAEIPDDLPDWLRPVASTASSDSEKAQAADDIGTWLREEVTGGHTGALTPPPGVAAYEEEPVIPVEPAPADRLELPDVEQLPKGKTGELPKWVALADEDRAEASAAPPPAAAPPARPAAPPPARPAAPPPPPAARPVAPPPPRQRIVATGEPAPPPTHPPAAVPAAYEQYRAQLEQNPDDHATRLNLARTLAQTGDVHNSIPQYETLIEHHSELDSVADDLRALITTNPALPAARRLLGDVYMRQGYLQEALDAYRGALDNL